MPLEVRQLTIKSSVDPAPDGVANPVDLTQVAERLKDEVLAECKVWFEEKLQQMRER
jgi:hypothetical protein